MKDYWKNALLGMVTGSVVAVIIILLVDHLLKL